MLRDKILITIFGLLVDTFAHNGYLNSDGTFNKEAIERDRENFKFWKSVKKSYYIIREKISKLDIQKNEELAKQIDIAIKTITKGNDTSFFMIIVAFSLGAFLSYYDNYDFKDNELFRELKKFSKYEETANFALRQLVSGDMEKMQEYREALLNSRVIALLIFEYLIFNKKIDVNIKREYMKQNKIYFMHFTDLKRIYDKFATRFN